MQATLPSPILSRLSELVATRTGLHFPAKRWGDLERGLSEVALDLGMADAESCAQRLLSAPVTHREIDILARHLTVGETYFFRHQDSFDVLERQVLPTLIRERRETGRCLRVWSAGCCTGEEAYSIAILLDRVIPDHDNWDISILATDINSGFLRKAMAGEYGDWSFRDTPEWVRERYFRDRRGGRFKLHEHVRRRVTFSSLNLASDEYPSTENGTDALDVIFCRNVLMYFGAQTARRVVDNLHRALVDGGWLVVSPAESSGGLFAQFTPVEHRGALLYRKDVAAVAPRCANPVHLPRYDTAIDAPPFPADMGRPPPGPTCRDADGSESRPHADHDTGGAIATAAVTPGPADRAARDCADQGRLAEAAEWCHKALAADKLNPAHHYLLGTIRREQGQDEEAARSLANAIYLEPDFVIAHYALGNLRQSQGRMAEAQRHFDNALTSLRTHPAGEVIPESDGLTSGRLREFIELTRANRPRPAIHG